MNNNSDTTNIVTCPFVKSNMWYLDYLKEVYIVNCIFNFVFAISAVIGNFLVLYSIIKTPSLHKPSSFLICNLAVTDLANGLLVQPLYVIYKIAEMNGFVNMSCYSGVVVNMLANLFSGISFITVTCISIDRYLALYLHLRYVAVVTTQKIVKIIAAFWVIGVIFVSFYPWKVSVSLGFGIVALILCLGISTFTFFKIFQVVRKHRAKVNDNSASYNIDAKRIAFHALNLSKYRQSVLTMVYIYVILVVCYFPYMATLASRLLIGLTKEYKLSLNVTTTIIYINSSINPLVYCFRLREFRNAILRALGKKRASSEISRTFHSIQRQKNNKESAVNMSHKASNV